MPSNELEGRTDRQQKLGLVAILGGIVLTALSFWLDSPSNDGTWTKQKAQDYQAASSKLHGMAHQLGHQSPDNASKEVSDEFQEALREYSELREQLDEARAGSGRWKVAMRVVGILLAIVGAIAYSTAGRQ